MASNEKEKGAIGRDKRTPILTALLFEFQINGLEVNDFNFELVFPECLRGMEQDKKALKRTMKTLSSMSNRKENMNPRSSTMNPHQLT